MTAEQPQRLNASQQEQIEALTAQVANSQADIDSLETRVDKATSLASTSEHLAYVESRRVDQLRSGSTCTRR